MKIKSLKAIGKNQAFYRASLKKEPLHDFSPIETLQMYGELMHVNKSEFKNYQSWLTLFNDRIKQLGCFVVPDGSWRGGIARDVEIVGTCPNLVSKISYDKASNKSICRFACISTKGLGKTDRTINPYIRSVRSSNNSQYAAISSRWLIQAVLNDKKALNELGYKPTTLYTFKAAQFRPSQEELERLKKHSTSFTQDTYWASDNPKLPIFKDSPIDPYLLTEDFMDQRIADKGLYEASVAAEKQQKEEKEKLEAEKKSLMEQEQKKAKELAPVYKGEFLGVFTPGETSLTLFKELLRLRGCELKYGSTRKLGSEEVCFKLPHGKVAFNFDKNQIASVASINLRGDKAVRTYVDQFTEKLGRPNKETFENDPTKVQIRYIWKTPKSAITIEEVYATRKGLPPLLANQMTDEAIKAEAYGIVRVRSLSSYEEDRKKELEEKKQQLINFNKLF